MRLIWSNGEGLIDNNTTKWPISVAPELSFTYEGIFFSEANNTKSKRVGGGSASLSEEEITEIVEYISTAQPISPIGLALLQEQEIMWGKIKLERLRRSQEGGYKVGIKWFHSDIFSRTQQTGLVMLGANIPQGLQWKTMDGSFITMTPTLALQIFGAAASSDQAIFTQAEAHKAAMLETTTPFTYNYLTGWPLIYGE